MKPRTKRYRDALIIWAVIYPLITVLLWLLEPVVQSWLLPAKTFLLTVIAVPILSIWALPLAIRVSNNKAINFSLKDTSVSPKVMR